MAIQCKGKSKDKGKRVRMKYPILRRELDRVAEKIGERLENPRGIKCNERRRGGAISATSEIPFADACA